jgi:hypothetical protein
VKTWLLSRTVKEWLALIALFASIAGAAILTGNRVWLIRILEQSKSWADIADIAKLDTLIIGLVLLSLGLAINRRTVKLSKDGFEASGGDEASHAGQAVAASAQATADEISNEAQ